MKQFSRSQLWDLGRVAVLLCCSVMLSSLAFAQASYCFDCANQWGIDECEQVGGGSVFDLGGQCLCYGRVSPIIIDTRGEGIKLTAATEGAVFDLSANGKPLRYSWTKPDSGNAFLALDRNGNGRIDNGSELFGNYTPQPASPTPNGFVALRSSIKPASGGNSDGVIDGGDAAFASLRLWIDANHNGISETEELFSLQSMGLYSISLSVSESERRDRFGNRFRYRAKLNIEKPRRNDELGPWAYDVFLTAVSPDLPVFKQPQRSAKDLPNTIDGSRNPERIPTDVAYRIFLRVAACPDVATSMQQKKCQLVIHSLKLDAADEQLLQAHLADFLSAVEPLDRQITELTRNKTPSDTLRQSLAAQRHELVKAKVAALRRNLSQRGVQVFDSHIELMKAKIKIIPTSPYGE